MGVDRLQLNQQSIEPVPPFPRPAPHQVKVQTRKLHGVEGAEKVELPPQLFAVENGRAPPRLAQHQGEVGETQFPTHRGANLGHGLVLLHQIAIAAGAVRLEGCQ